MKELHGSCYGLLDWDNLFTLPPQYSANKAEAISVLLGLLSIWSFKPALSFAKYRRVCFQFFKVLEGRRKGKKKLKTC